jgi:hypothetical protein
VKRQTFGGGLGAWVSERQQLNEDVQMGLEALLGADLAGLDGLAQRLVVALVLLGVGVGELEDRAVEA